MWGAAGINLCQEARQSKPHLMHCTGWGYDTYGDRNALTYIVSSSPQPPPTSEKLDPTFDCLDYLVDWGLMATAGAIINCNCRGLRKLAEVGPMDFFSDEVF